MAKYGLLAKIEQSKYEGDLLVKKFVLSSVDFLNRAAGKDLLEIQAEKDGFNLFFRNPHKPFLYYRLLETLLYPLEVRGGLAVGRDNREVLENGTEALQTCARLETGALFKSGKKTDQYLNQMLKLRNEIREHPTIQANLVQTFSEFLFPLLADLSALKRSDMVARLSLVLKFKEEFFQALKKEGPSNRFYSHEFPEIDFGKYRELIEKSDLDQKDFPEGYRLLHEDYWKKGFSTKVSEILGITRQIIDRNYKYLNFLNLRNLDATIAFFLRDNF